MSPAMSTAQEALCGACQAIDLDEIFNLDPAAFPEANYGDGLKVADLGRGFRSQARSTSSCPLCRLFAVAARRPGDVPGGKAEDESVPEADRPLFSLWARSTTGMQTHTTLAESAKMVADPTTVPRLVLQVCEEPVNMFTFFQSDLYLYDASPLFPRSDRLNKDSGGLQTRHTRPDLLDPGILRSFLDHCDVQHRDATTCGSGHERPQPALPSFRVIDVHTIRIVDPGPGPVYTALSYRWGARAYDPDCQPFDPDGRLRDATALPEVIADAIKVTRDLGFRYCWVDRYCIPQDDPVAMEIQFAHMDQVYRMAEVTLISDSNSPYLPGVTRRLKASVSLLRAGNRTLAAMALRFEDMRHQVRWSPWSKRGWTYQEGLFSRRRLYFTDLGAYYECGRMITGDPGFGAPQPRWSVNEKDRAPWLRHAGSSSREARLLSCLAEYSARDLTFSSDRLNAALGIFHAFEVPGLPLRHHLGTPVLRLGGTADPCRYGADTVAGVVAGFLWGMMFDGRGRCACGSIPSWSWTGWNEHVFFYASQMRYQPVFEPRQAEQMTVHVTSELADGTLLPWDSMENVRQLASMPMSGLSKFIHIEALAVQLALQGAGFDDSDESDPVEEFVVNLGTRDYEKAEDKAFPCEELRWKILQVPGRGHFYVEVDVQGQPGKAATNDMLMPEMGFVIPHSESGDLMTIILVVPMDEDGEGTMGRFGSIKLQPKAVFFRPCLGLRRQESRETEEGVDQDDVSSDEEWPEVDVPSWGEFMGYFWASVGAERRSIRLG